MRTGSNNGAGFVAGSLMAFATFAFISSSRWLCSAPRRNELITPSSEEQAATSTRLPRSQQRPKPWLVRLDALSSANTEAWASGRLANSREMCLMRDGRSNAAPSKGMMVRY